MDCGKFPGIRSLIAADTGVTAIEYALIAAAIGVVLVAVFGLVGTELGNSFLGLAQSMQKS